MQPSIARNNLVWWIKQDCNASAKREDVGASMAKKAKVNYQYKVKMSVQAYDLAKAGSAMTIKVHERGKL
jgi:hypothetical protein